jgi:CHAT domain-containing protein
MRKDYIELVKNYILSGGRELQSFKKAINHLEKRINETSNLNLRPLFVGYELLYDLAEKNNPETFLDIINHKKVIKCINMLKRINLVLEAHFLELLQMFFVIAFRGHGGRFTRKAIIKEDESEQELFDRLEIISRDFCQYLSLLNRFKDKELLNHGLKLYIQSLESSKKLYIEFDSKKRTSKIYEEALDWIEKNLELNEIVFQHKMEIYGRWIQDVKFNRDYKKAEKINKKALSDYVTTNKKTEGNYKHELALIRKEFAVIYLDMGRYNEAHDWFLDASKIFIELLQEEENEIVSLEFILLRIDWANNYHRLDHIKIAINMLEKCWKEINEIDRKKLENLDSTKLEIVKQLSKFNQERNNHQETRKYLQKTKKLIEKQEKNKTILGAKTYESYRIIGIIERIYDLEKSDHYFQYAIKKYENEINEINKGMYHQHYIATLHELGTNYKFKKQYHQAKKYYHKAVELQQEVVRNKAFLHNLDMLALYLSNLGAVYLKLDELQLARITLQYAIKISEEIIRESKNSAKYAQVPRIFQSHFCLNLLKISDLWIKYGEYDQTIKIIYPFLKTINRLAEKETGTTFDNQIRLGFLLNLGKSLIFMGQINEAYNKLEEAYNEIKVYFSKHPLHYASPLFEIATYYSINSVLLGEKDEARKIVDEVIELMKDKKKISEETFNELINRLKKNKEKIDPIINLKNEFKRFLCSDLGLSYLNIILINKILSRGSIKEEIMIEFQKIAKNPPKDDVGYSHIFNLIEKTRDYYISRDIRENSLLNNSQPKKLLKEVHKQLTNQRKKLQLRSEQLRKSELGNLEQNTSLLNEINLINHKALQVFRNLLSLVDKPLKNEQTIIEIAEFFKTHQNEVLFIITELDTCMLLICLSHTNCQIERHSLDFRNKGWKLYDLFMEYLQAYKEERLLTKLLKEISQLGNEMWESLPETIRSLLTQAEVIVLSVSDGFETIPFELMKDDNNFLGLNKRIVRIFSPLSYVNRSKSQESNGIIGKQKNILVAYEPNAPEADTIENAEEECESITQLIGQSKIASNCSVTRLPEGQVEKHRLIQLLSKKTFSLIHFAAHGEFNRIYISNRKDLNAVDLLENYLWFGSPIIFLNLCNTGQFIHTIKQKVKGFVPTLSVISLGAIIASQNPIESENAKLMSDKFYSKLLEGETVGQALQYARNCSYQESESYDKLEWANFILYNSHNQKLIK